MTLYTRGFDCFVTSTAAPIATGWSDNCRVGIAPTERTRLSTAHCNMRARYRTVFSIAAHGNRDRRHAAAAMGNTTYTRPAAFAVC